MATSVTLKPNAIDISGSTSGTTTLQASAVAGTTTLTLPAATDTLVGKATTDTLTNKTLTGAAMNGTLGATTPSTASVTTLTTSSTVTHSGGTANGVAYLDGSKVLTTGSALVFDGTNLGIGTSSPTAKLTLSGNQSFVEKTAAYLGVDVATSAGNGGNLTVKAGAGSGAGNTAGTLYLGAGRGNASASNGSIVFGIAQATNAVGLDSTLMTLDSSGNLGVGNTSPAARIDAFRSTVGTYFLGGGGDNVARQLAITSSTTTNSGDTHTFNAQSGTGVIAFATTGTERARIDSSGNLLVGTTSSNVANNTITGFGLDGKALTASYGMGINSTSATGTQYFVVFGRNSSACGTISSTATNSTTYATSSDYRLKENIAPMTGALATVAQLNPVTYTWKEDGTSGQGFIAHELQAIIADAVVGEKDAVNEDGSIKPQGIDTSYLVATLTAAIKEQQAIITQLQADVAALKGA